MDYMNWDEWYELAQKYYEHYKNLLVPSNFKTTNGYEYDENGKNLGNWIVRQRKAYLNINIPKSQRTNPIPPLSEDREIKLRQIGMVFRCGKENWEYMYGLAKKYYQHYGNTSMDINFKTKNGYEYDSKGYCLGIWVNQQKIIYNNIFKKKQSDRGSTKKLSIKHIQMLKAIEVELKIDEEDWKELYNLAQKYYDHFGNLLVPENFKTTNGYEYDSNGRSLGIWVHETRNLIEKTSNDKDQGLTDEQIDIIVSNPLPLGLTDMKWQMMYDLAQKYYEYYGNLLVPVTFKTKNGYEYDETGENLGSWIANQRIAYRNVPLAKNERRNKWKPLSIIKFKMLEKIEMKYCYKEGNWEVMYDLAKKYYEHYGNLRVPADFKTINGYEYDENGKNLKEWIVIQKRELSDSDSSKSNEMLDDNKRELLETIGLTSNSLSEKWKFMYLLAKKYYEHYGNLQVPTNFKTTNGYEYDENGENLGIWIRYQRNAYSKQSSKIKPLSDKKIELLQQIDMVFDVRKDKEKKEDLCKLFGIEYDCYSKYLKNLTYKELNSKITYIISEGMSVFVNNRLNPIFFMSDINLQAAYGISKKEMINNYFKDYDARVKKNVLE